MHRFVAHPFTQVGVRSLQPGARGRQDDLVAAVLSVPLFQNYRGRRVRRVILREIGTWQRLKLSRRAITLRWQFSPAPGV
jgi:hypothetical protein